jgi:hypothetical protein
VAAWSEDVKKMEKNKKQHVMIALLCLLLVFTGVQAMQINALHEISSSGVTYPQASSSSAPAPIRSAPTMVGGC